MGAMDYTVAKKLLEGHKNFVFLGEAGSGKTETAVNLALSMVGCTDRSVHFFDMDQTKPLFRARDAEGSLESGGVTFHFQSQYLDAPTVAPGVRERLRDENSVVLMDVGGGSHGSHMIGQFSDLLGADNTLVLYLINPYRAWSGSRENINATVRKVMGAARLADFRIVANPNLGPNTGSREIMDGIWRIGELFPDDTPEFICALSELAPDIREAAGAPVLPIKLATMPEWMTGD